MSEIRFGTDGWRAIIGKGFTFANVKLVAQAIADYVKGPGSAVKGSGVVIGHDTRFMGSDFAGTVAGVLAANGIKVLLTDGPTSTPAVSLAIKQNNLIGGVMITASHNPPNYSGIKYKAEYAGPADSDIIKPIESVLGKTPVSELSVEEAQEKGLIKKTDLNSAHLKFLKSYLNLSLLNKTKFTICVDVMYGSGDHLIEKVLKDSGSKVTTIHSENNPGFGGTPPEPIERNLGDLISIMKKGRFSIGIATDGDVDRIGAVSNDGKYITSSQIIALLLIHLVEDKKWKGDVAKTISGSVLIDVIAKSYGLNLHETPVGFKYICKQMQTKDILIGGEESGGIGFKNYVPERDGTLAGLLLLEMMAQRKKSIKQLLADLGKRFGQFCSVRLDMEYPDEKKAKLFSSLKEQPLSNLLGKSVTGIKTYDGVKFIARDKSWLLFRASGTEPILRIYCEADSDAKAKKLLNVGKEIALSK